MIARLGGVLSRFATRAVPDPFAIALALTLLVAVAGRLALGDADDASWTLLLAWMEGFASAPLLAFALQMCLVLVTGHALALSPPVQTLVRKVATLPKTNASAAALVAFVACASAMVHWGLGAIVGAFLAREIGRDASARGVKLHYPLLGAAAYAGLAVWHGGLSGSAPLKVAGEGHFAETLVGVVPVSQTLFSPLNLLVMGSMLVVLPLLFAWMTPADTNDYEPPRELAPLEERTAPVINGIPDWLREAPLVGRVLGGVGLAAVLAAWGSGRVSLDLDLLNLCFLFAGVALQGRLGAYVEAIADGAKGAGAIILQFPFYFGILGMMKAAGLIAVISGALVSFANETTFPAIAFLSAGVVNLMVPSGGGQWAVQGEILLTTGRDLGVDPATTILAFSYGDGWTNMLQPFWALPLLGVMGLPASKIIGYTGVACLVMGILVPTALALFG